MEIQSERYDTFVEKESTNDRSTRTWTRGEIEEALIKREPSSAPPPSPPPPLEQINPPGSMDVDILHTALRVSA